MMPRISPAAALLLSASALLFASCGKPEIRVYLAPQDAPPPPEQSTTEAPAPPPKPPDRPKPKISYTKPEGWTEAAAGQLSLVAFSLKGEGGEASVNVTPLADMRGRELDLVNMYRKQTGQPEIEAADLGKTLLPVEVAGGEGQLLELLGSNHDKPTRLITVIAHRDGRSWFYRLSGDDTFVTTQKTAFLDFIKTVKISEAPANDEPASPEAAPKDQP